MTEVRTEFPEAPICSLPSIEQNEHKQEIFNRLLSGWSPSRISQTLHKECNVLILPHDIKQFFTEIPLTLLLPPSELRARLKQIDVNIDAVGQMASLLRLVADRLDTALLLEESTHKKCPKTEPLIQSYWRMLERYVNILQKLGDLPTAAQEIKVGASEDTGSLPSLRDLIASRIDRDPDENEGEGIEFE